ncbi:hypothetical protein A3J19_04465 [Candidatus Daviesbacteria bacterium RIFCSPLOWO2_02_FULL_41_8]|uniref:Gcp-like domain-containing protein n=2 Tax=Candidatus Daviesiibacteriota TaxID=1752718 RepID=A0A1F5NJ08_9BACT|nr:MAG: hypothetical protein A3D83_00940 [Candidatus Daviesbacteria bacterium RIFCSPHIGHO2_02_FULL_41_10]OGE77608.1 MAG: hypothetical protein A3J19_04465 [Candidatus Daviesbacteria bacterium RIFCSPLOWO2_02_FULL_41_8]
MVLRRSRKLCLYIDTRGGSTTKDRKVIKVSLKKEGKVVGSLSADNEYGSQALLPLILKLFRTYNPGLSSQIQSGIGSWDELEGIEVETGPGSFTGLRVGVSVANALGFALGIPVNGKKVETKLQYN